MGCVIFDAQGSGRQTTTHAVCTGVSLLTQQSSYFGNRGNDGRFLLIPSVVANVACGEGLSKGCRFMTDYHSMLAATASRTVC